MGRRRRLFVLGLSLALVVSAPAAADDVERQKAAIDGQLAELRAQIDASKEKEGVLTSQLSAVVSEVRAAESAVVEAQSRLVALEAELGAAQGRLARLTHLLQAQTRRVQRLQAEYERAVAILGARVRQIYIEEPPDLLSFLVSVSSFDELVDNIEFLDRIGAQDQRIARAVAEAKARAVAERRATEDTRRLQVATVTAITARTEEARAIRDRLTSDRDRLAAARALKQSALVSERETREEYLREAAALAAQSAALAARIQAAQASAGPSSTGQPSAAGFVWPVDGPVTSGFGVRWGRMHEGLDIAASSGTPIRAAAAGTVIYAGWLSGYGNLVVLDHGSGLATAYAHASAILVGVGQQVARGQTVALVGATGHATGPHLHFEVRVNGAAVDPLLYL